MQYVLILVKIICGITKSWAQTSRVLNFVICFVKEVIWYAEKICFSVWLLSKYGCPKPHMYYLKLLYYALKCVKWWMSTIISATKGILFKRFTPANVLNRLQCWVLLCLAYPKTWKHFGSSITHLSQVKNYNLKIACYRSGLDINYGLDNESDDVERARDFRNNFSQKF